MPTFQQWLDSIKDLKEHQQIRIETIQEIESITKRPLIVYAANTRRGGFNVPNTIDDSDITSFSDLIEGITDRQIDVFLNSPGGSAEATERIVNLLRQNFDYIRYLIPHTAYSAATMMALSGDEILMDDRSTLGPIDPQIIITTPQGGITSAPVQDILDGFAKVRQILKDQPDAITAYLPMLQKLDLHIFEICENAKLLAHTLAQNWLENYMFKDRRNRKKMAATIAEKLSSHKENLSRARTIGFYKAHKLGLEVRDLRNNSELRQKLWQLYCLIELYFDRTPAVKLFENSRGTSWARLHSEQIIQIPVQMPKPSSQPPQSQ